MLRNLSKTKKQKPHVSNISNGHANQLDNFSLNSFDDYEKDFNTNSYFMVAHLVCASHIEFACEERMCFFDFLCKFAWIVFNLLISLKLYSFHISIENKTQQKKRRK